jgi:hypothetical protein
MKVLYILPSLCVYVWVWESVFEWMCDCDCEIMYVCVNVSMWVREYMYVLVCENECMFKCVSVYARASSHPIITVLVLFPNSSAISPSHLKLRMARRQYWLEALDYHGVLAWVRSKSPNLRTCRHDCLLSTSPSLNPSSRIRFIALQGTWGVWRQAVLWFCAPA